jgi:hypothetical protein
MSSSCGVPLGVSAVRVSRIDCMNYVSGTIEAVAVTPVKSLPRMAERCTKEEIGSDDTLDLMRYCESYIFPLLGTQQHNKLDKHCKVGLQPRMKASPIPLVRSRSLYLLAIRLSVMRHIRKAKA